MRLEIRGRAVKTLLITRGQVAEAVLAGYREEFRHMIFSERPLPWMHYFTMEEVVITFTAVR